MGKITPTVRTFKAELSKLKDNAMLIGFFKDKLSLWTEFKKFDIENKGIISSFIKDSKFKGEKDEIKNIYINKNIKNIVLVGLGEEKKFTLDALSSTIAEVSKRLRDNGTESFSILLNSFSNNKFDDAEAIEKITVSSLLGLYKFSEFKTKDQEKMRYIKEINILANSSSNFEKEIEYSVAVADAVNKTRDLINSPPNIATPQFVADYAKELARKSNLKCTILDEKQIQKLKMGCFLGVAQGSLLKPRLVILEYYGTDRKKKPVAIVGKGITFDSGGLNLKPYPYILNMKDDKGGAVAAIHVIEACSKLKLPVNLFVVTPICENMPSGASYRPDDILTAYNGITVEIKNTDAEGRLVLADALSYAAEMKPDAIVDIATLTGASMIALGYVGTPFLSTDEKLSKRLKDASAKSLEKIWEFPLWSEYDENIKSDVADLKHISEEGDAGVIIGASFLKNFVNEIPWAHIDIGTTVWSKADKGVLAKGATGATVRLLIEMLREWK